MSTEIQNEVIISAAKQYASIGWHVLPVLGKVPQGEAWQLKATTSEVGYVFGSHKFDGVGVLLGRKSSIVDIECDSDEAEEFFFRLLGGEIPDTPTFQSTRGKHYLFCWPESVDLPDTNVFKVNGLEFRIGAKDGCQSVFPPSAGRTWEIGPEVKPIDFPHWQEVLKIFHESRKPKKFTGGGVYAPRYGDSETLNVPKWLTKHGIEILGSASTNDGVTRWYIECPGIDQHTTHNGFRDCCVTQDMTGKLGGCCFHQSCGMSDWERLRDAIGGLEWSDYHEDEPQENLPDVDLSGLGREQIPIITDIVQANIKTVAKKVPHELLDVPGFINDLVAYNLSTARCPQPELAFCSALALLSVITGRKIQDYSGTRTNIYVVCPAPSGSGKDHARQLNKQLLSLAGDKGDKMIGPEGIGSHAGLVSYLAENEATLFQLDEFADFMEAAGDLKKSPHLAMVITKLLSLYTSSATTWISDALADLKKIKRIVQPHAVIYATCTPDAFWNSINSRSLNGGFIGRLISLEAGYSEEYRPVESSEPPAALVEWVRWWFEFNEITEEERRKLGNLVGVIVPRKPVTIPMTAEARQRVESQAREITMRLRNDDPTSAAIWARSTERVSKLALLFACSRLGPKNDATCIEVADAEKAIGLSNYITRHILQQAKDRVSESEWEAKRKKVLRAIGYEGITRRELSRKTRFLKDRERREAIQELIDMGDVVIEVQSTVTKSAELIKRV